MSGRLGPNALLGGLLLAVAVGALGGAPATSAAESECIAPEDGPEVCLEVTHTPQAPVASTEEAPTYTSFSATVANHDSSTVTHVTLEIAPIVTELSQGFVLFSATPSVGECDYSASSAALSCSFDSLAGGAQATLDLVLGTPSTPGTYPLEVSASLDEGPSDNPGNGGKVDTVSLTEETTVLPPDGATASTFVPEGTGVQLGISEGGQEGGLTLPPQEFSTTAELEFTSTEEIPFVCPRGFVCRTGDWFSATIPGTFDPPAEFRLFWPANLVSQKQTEKNFVVFYLPSAGANLEIISARCNSALTVIPCVKDVTLFKKGPLKGALAATVVRINNGKMH